MSGMGSPFHQTGRIRRLGQQDVPSRRAHDRSGAERRALRSTGREGTALVADSGTAAAFADPGSLGDGAAGCCLSVALVDLSVARRRDCSDGANCRPHRICGHARGIPRCLAAGRYDRRGLRPGSTISSAADRSPHMTEKPVRHGWRSMEGSTLGRPPKSGRQPLSPSGTLLRSGFTATSKATSPWRMAG